MFRRDRALRDPVTLLLDGSAMQAERGEPVAIALLASDLYTLARSPKLHRPRGPSCLRGACDGCLARVDDVPNVMTCLLPAAGGERIETQNVMGTRRSDLLRATDWFFPDGIDHHHLLAGVPGLSEAMQTFARKLAGLGRLPAAIEAERPARRAEVDVLVVGAGLAGLVVASHARSAGLSTMLVDDATSIGGSLSGIGALGSSPGGGSRADGVAALAAALPRAGVEILAGATAAGVYLGEVLVASRTGAVVVKARATVFATGAHDGTVAAPNNDLPGVMAARALRRLVARGVLPDGPTAIVGEGFWADDLAVALGESPIHRVAAADLVAIRGSGRVKSVLAKVQGRERRLEAVVVAVATPGAPAFEIAEQAGAAIESDPSRGYRVVADDRGRVGDGFWAAGECTGLAFDPDAIVAQAERAASDIVATLSPR